MSTYHFDYGSGYFDLDFIAACIVLPLGNIKKIFALWRKGDNRPEKDILLGELLDAINSHNDKIKSFHDGTFDSEEVYHLTGKHMYQYKKSSTAIARCIKALEQENNHLHKVYDFLQDLKKW